MNITVTVKPRFEMYPWVECYVCKGTGVRIGRVCSPCCGRGILRGKAIEITPSPWAQPARVVAEIDGTPALVGRLGAPGYYVIIPARSP